MYKKVRSTAEALERLSSSNSKSLLSAQTKIEEGGYEKAFKDCLLELRIKSNYGPFTAIVGHYLDRDITYTPDFVTDLKIDGKNVILEPHPMMLKSSERTYMDLVKFRLFRRRYGEAFYLIVISDLKRPVMELKAGIRLPLSESMDEYWIMSRVNENSGDDTLTRRDVGLQLRNLVNKLRM